MEMWIAKDGFPYAGDRQGDDPVAPSRPDNGVWDKNLQDWVVKPDPTGVFQKIRGIFQQAIFEKSAIATPAVQKELLKLSSVVERALELGLYEAASEAIKEPILDPELEPYRTEMLAAIPKLVAKE